MWNVQMKWYKKTLQASTADFKIFVMHHKPIGEIAAKIHTLVVVHGVQLLIGSHTHEFGSWWVQVVELKLTLDVVVQFTAVSLMNTDLRMLR